MKQYAFLLLIIASIVLISGCTAPEPICGNGVTETGEECDGSTAACPDKNGEQAIDCSEDCKCIYESEYAQGYCGDEIVQQPNSEGFWEECDGSNEPCGEGGTCEDDCTCSYPSGGGDGTGDGGAECPPDKVFHWTQHCLPPLIGSVKFVTYDPPGYIKCYSVSLAELHSRGYCLGVNVIDPACAYWCKGEECYVYECDHETIPCITTYHYVPKSIGDLTICVAEVTYYCEGECNCRVVDHYVICPDPDCEADCPFISTGSGTTLPLGGSNGGGTDGGDDSSNGDDGEPDQTQGANM